MGKEKETRSFFDLKKNFIFYASYHNDSVSRTSFCQKYVTDDDTLNDSVKLITILLTGIFLLMSSAGECWNPPALYLEHSLVWVGVAAHAGRLRPGPDLPRLPTPPWRGANHHHHHHHH